MERKFKDRKELSDIVSHLKRGGYTSGIVNGVFDIIHAGHIYIISEAKRYCDILIVALNSDRSVSRLKGERRPILKEVERINIISALEDVDFVTLFDEGTAARTLQIIRPDFHIKGVEYRYQRLPEEDIDKKYNIKILLLGDRKINSTSDIIKQIKSL